MQMNNKGKEKIDKRIVDKRELYIFLSFRPKRAQDFEEKCANENKKIKRMRRRLIAKKQCIHF